MVTTVKQEIAVRNDLFRTTMIQTPSHRVCLSECVADLPPEKLQELMAKVRAYNQFTPANDPHGEHDFGRVEFDGQSYYWKIDYYDLNFEYGADPYNDLRYARMLMVMHVSEY